MINVIVQMEPVDTGGTLEGLRESLTTLVSNAALEQLKNRFDEQIESDCCAVHQEGTGTITLRIPGGDITKSEEFICDFSGFCCNQFKEQAEARVVEVVRGMSGEKGSDQ